MVIYLWSVCIWCVDYVGVSVSEDISLYTQKTSGCTCVNWDRGRYREVAYRYGSEQWTHR